MDISKLCPHCMREYKEERVETCPYCGKNLKINDQVRHQLKPFTILSGKYLVGDVLGEGGFGITYIGFDLNLEIQVAIKEFYPNGFVTRESGVTSTVTIYRGENEEAILKWKNNFLDEARSLAKCSHLSGVVGVKDFFQENNTVYIVQEYLDGKTLKEYIKSRGGKIPFNELLKDIEPVIIALGEVHEQGLIHRDISPDNIMMLKSGGMKVLDFGAARSYLEGDEKSRSVLLKPGYAPEEQYRTRGKQGPWSDVYALCATIYKCITGITPPESMERLRNDDMKMPSALGIAISPAHEKALAKGMAVLAESRIQSMKELYKALYSSITIQSATPQFQDIDDKPASIPVEETETDVSEKRPGLSMNLSNIKALLSNKKFIVCGVMAVTIWFFLIFISSLSGKSQDVETIIPENSEINESEMVDSEISTQKFVPEEEDILGNDAKEILKGIDDLAGNSNSYSDLQEVLEQYYAFAVEYNAADNIAEKVQNVFSYYEDDLMQYIALLDGQEVSSGLYEQMRIELSNALDLANKLVEINIPVNYTNIDIKYNSLPEDYKERYIQAYVKVADQTISENGVVSRGSLWAVMKNVDQLDFYDKDNVNDPLHVIYKAAYALHIDSEIESLDSADTVTEIISSLPEADYSPLLIYLLRVRTGAEVAIEWENGVFNIMAAYGYNIYDMDIGTMRNFIYYFSVDDSDNAEACRKQVVDYMKNIL